MSNAFRIVSEALGYHWLGYSDLQAQPEEKVVVLKSVILAGGRDSPRIVILVQQLLPTKWVQEAQVQNPVTGRGRISPWQDTKLTV